jgi:hypothetical protein
MAGVDVNKDDEKTINLKVHNLWVHCEGEIYYESTNFNVSRGNFLKMSAYRSFTPFLDRAVYDWYFPLNKIDDIDGRTTLDYIQNEIEKNKGQPNEKPLQSYYDLLKKAGAKHKFELTPEEIKRNGLAIDHINCPANAPCKK